MLNVCLICSALLIFKVIFVITVFFLYFYVFLLPFWWIKMIIMWACLRGCSLHVVACHGCWWLINTSTEYRTGTQLYSSPTRTTVRCTYTAKLTYSQSRSAPATGRQLQRYTAWHTCRKSIIATIATCTIQWFPAIVSNASILLSLNVSYIVLYCITLCCIVL